ncbi:MAG: hypothetical protein WCT54_00495 [Patescibacteria group bacterium]|jgi:hypothetical protein
MENDEIKSAMPKSRSRKNDQTSVLARPKLISDKEKQSLIMEHAKNRQPADNVQKFSLVIGVAICAVAISAGWLYSMRQGLAEIFPAAQTQESVGDAQGKAAWEKYQYAQQIHAGASGMIDQVQKVEDAQIVGLNPILVQGLMMASATDALVASTTENIRANFFTPPAIDQASDKANLPTGLTQNK